VDIVEDTVEEIVEDTDCPFQDRNLAFPVHGCWRKQPRSKRTLEGESFCNEDVITTTSSKKCALRQRQRLYNKM
jgi:hypothetical protein